MVKFPRLRFMPREAIAPAMTNVTVMTDRSRLGDDARFVSAQLKARRERTENRSERYHLGVAAETIDRLLRELGQ